MRKTGGGFESAERTAPRLNIAPRTGGSGWRDRLASREASGGDAPEPAREEVPVRKTGGYVPPHLRAGASAGSGSPPPPPAPREAPSNGPSERYVPRHAREPSAPKPEEPKGAAGGKWVPRWKQQQS